MTDAQPLAPTDAEIFVVAREAGLLPDNSHPAPETRAARKHSHAVQAFARAVLAKWGTPPAVAGDMPAWQQGFLTTMNQDPYPALGWWFVQFWEGDDVAARVYGNDAETLRRRCAAITTPRPTQAQAGAVPLTDGQVAIIARSVLEAPAADGVAPAWTLAVGIARAIERAHGIGAKNGDRHA